MGGESEGLESSEQKVHAWEVLSEKTVLDCPVFDLVSRRCRHPERGTEADFYVLASRDWVNVLPITKDHEIVMVRQWRFGVEQFSWEIPGGVMENGEDPMEAGLRELREETGYETKRARLLASVRPNPAIQSNTCYFVLAEGVAPTGEQDWDHHEEIEVRLFPIDTVYEMAAKGEIIHSLVMNALFHYYPEWLKRKARRRS